jgi:hypothetical protein
MTLNFFRKLHILETPGGTINTTGDHAGAMFMVEEMMYSTPARSDGRP